MDFIANRVSQIELSEIRKMYLLANENTLDLGLGQLGFKAPQALIDAGIHAFKGKLGYTPNAGIPELRKAIAKEMIDLRDLVRNKYELMQLYRIYEGKHQDRELSYKKSGPFVSELRNLAKLKLIKRKDGVTLGGMPKSGDLIEYVEITEKGIDYIKRREDFGLENPRRDKNPEFWASMRSGAAG